MAKKRIVALLLAFLMITLPSCESQESASGGSDRTEDTISTPALERENQVEQSAEAGQGEDGGGTEAVSPAAGEESATSNNAAASDSGKETVTPVPDDLPEFDMVTVPKANYYHEETAKGNVIYRDSLNTVSFDLGETEVTYQLWYAVRVWAEENGYRFLNEGCEGSEGTAGAEPTEAKLEPVTCVSWIDCVVWLNALSEMTGKEPVYLDADGNVHRDAMGSAEEIFAPENVVARLRRMGTGFPLPWNGWPRPGTSTE